MSNSDAVAPELIVTRKAAAIDATDPVPASSGVVAVSGGFASKLRRGVLLTDGQLALLLSAGLFLLSAWPLALTEVPPYQDLPNHLAAVTVIDHADRYPEFVFNGFFKTNAALFAWLCTAGKLFGTQAAARIFALVVLAANALVLPRLVLSLTRSRLRMLAASLFAWPMVHNWFVSMGMLDFALAVPLSLALLILLDRQRRKPSLSNGLLATALAAATWYAHVFPLLVVHLLVFIEAMRGSTWRERMRGLGAMVAPLVPVAFLVLLSLAGHMSDGGPMTGFIDSRKNLPAWELAYNLWAEWFWAFSKLTLTSLLPCLALAAIGLHRRKDAPPFFSPAALLVLAALYALLPYVVTNWFHVNSRIIPFVWIALLVRVPERLPKRLAVALGASAVLYSAGMGIDFVRLERERREFTAGIGAVPEGARLLPLLFRQKASSDNTRNIMHFWGYYVTEKLTAAPLLFAHSHSFPVMYSTPPPVRFNHLVLEGFAASMARPGAVCRNMLDSNVVVDDCEGAYRKAWAEFWADATPRYDHLLLWDITPEARANIPAAYHVVFERERLAILARDDGGSRVAKP